MKIGSRFFLGRESLPFARLAKALFLAFERARVHARGAERRASGIDHSFGLVHLLLGAAFVGFELEHAQAFANAMKLGAGEILNALEPSFEASPFGAPFALRLRRRPESPFADGAPRGSLPLRSSFGVAERACARIDLLPPERDERLEGVALLQRSFLSAVTRG